MPAKEQKGPTPQQWFGIALLLFFAWQQGWLGGVVGPTEGPRRVLVVHETEDDTAAISSEILKLRVGPHADHLKSKGHTLDIIDDDKLDPILPKFAPYTPPEVIVLQPPDKLIGRAPFTTADAAIEFLKKNGG